MFWELFGIYQAKKVTRQLEELQREQDRIAEEAYEDGYEDCCHDHDFSYSVECEDHSCDSCDHDDCSYNDDCDCGGDNCGEDW